MASHCCPRSLQHRQHHLAPTPQPTWVHRRVMQPLGAGSPRAGHMAAQTTGERRAARTSLATEEGCSGASMRACAERRQRGTRKVAHRPRKPRGREGVQRGGPLQQRCQQHARHRARRRCRVDGRQRARARAGLYPPGRAAQGMGARAARGRPPPRAPAQDDTGRGPHVGMPVSSKDRTAGRYEAQCCKGAEAGTRPRRPRARNGRPWWRWRA